MSSLHVVQENKETHKPEANTRHVTFKGTELNPKPCSSTYWGILYGSGVLSLC